MARQGTGRKVASAADVARQGVVAPLWPTGIGLSVKSNQRLAFRIGFVSCRPLIGRSPFVVRLYRPLPTTRMSPPEVLVVVGLFCLAPDDMLINSRRPLLAISFRAELARNDDLVCHVTVF